MKIVIVGNGKVGFTLAEQLVREEHDIIVVDSNDSALHKAADALDIMGIRGNGVSVATLRDAGADTADLLIAATNSDEVNMVCCLTAKNLGTKYTIARIRNREYAAGMNELRHILGIDMIINPENATAASPPRPTLRPSAGAVWN